MLKRMTFLIFALALLIGMGVTANALAGDTTGSMVYRWEGMNNLDQSSDMDDAAGFGQLRSRVSFGGDVNGNASYMFTVENYQIFGDPAADANSIYQATFTMADFLFEDFDVTIGRMPMSYGRERVVGVDDWQLNRNITFEGCHDRYSFDSGWLDFFKFKMVETFGGKYDDGVGDTDLMGLYMHYDANEDFFFEPYVMLMTTENWADPDIDNDRMMVFGALFDYVHEGIHFYGEAVMQSGTSYLPAEMDQSGLGYYAGLFYNFDSAVNPYIGFEYNFASGDDVTTAEDEDFRALFGSTSEFLGLMNEVAWCDIVALRFAGGFTPTENLDVSVDFYVFNSAEEVGGQDAIGNEIDVKFDYMLNGDVDLEGGFGMFTADENGDMYVTPGDPTYFAWAGASLDF